VRLLYPSQSSVRQATGGSHSSIRRRAPLASDRHSMHSASSWVDHTFSYTTTPLTLSSGDTLRQRGGIRCNGEHQEQKDPKGLRLLDLKDPGECDWLTRKPREGQTDRRNKAHLVAPTHTHTLHTMLSFLICTPTHHTQTCTRIETWHAQMGAMERATKQECKRESKRPRGRDQMNLIDDVINVY